MVRYHCIPSQGILKVLVVGVLLQCSANINPQDYHDETAILIMVQFQINSTLDVLISEPSLDIASQIRIGRDAFHILALSGNRDAMKAFRSKRHGNIDVQNRDANGDTCIELAAQRMDFKKSS